MNIVYENEAYVHFDVTHFGTAEDSPTNLQLEKKFNIKDIEDIRTRYLQMMKIQNQENLKIVNKETGQVYKNTVERLENLQNFELDLQKKAVEIYNQNASKVNFNQYAQGLRDFVSHIQNNGKKEEINKFFSVFTVPVNQKAAGQLLDAVKNSNEIQVLDMEDILNMESLRELVEKGQKKDTSTFYTIWNDINSLMQTATETLAAYAGQIWSKGTTWETIKECVIGTKPQTVSISFGNEKKSVESKSADIKLPGTGIDIDINLLENNEKLNGTIIVTPKFNFATIKSYISDRNIKLTSYSQSNSWLITALRNFYRDQYKNQNELDYVLYNTLVFQNKGNKTIKENFKIIKQDLTLGYAEKFLVGFNANEAQRLFIYRLKAIPIMDIIAKIIKDATDKVANDKFFGTNGRHFFYVNIDKIPVILNEREDKIRDRLERVKNDINNLKVMGQMNSKALAKLMGLGPLNP